MQNRVVIIGSGAAAYECVAAMREEHYEGEIHVFSDTNRAPYNPMLTTYYACGKLPYEGMFPFGSHEEDGEVFWKKLDVEFHGQDPVITLDTQKKTITSKNGLNLTFDQCLIASGATPIVPPVGGHDSKRVYTVRTVEDAIALHEAQEKKPKRVVVIGASMVGVKVVELFKKVGAEVCLADLAPRIFPLAAHEECSTVIEGKIEEQGVKLRFGEAFSGLEETEDGIKVFFGENQEPEIGDLVVLCIGVRANLSFVNREEIEMDRGLLIDNRMETSVKGIYAAGDVAQGMDVLGNKKVIIGLWASARTQGRTAGLNMAGKDATYEGNILHNITHFMDMDFVGLGQVTGYTHMDVEKTKEGLSMLFWDGDKLIGANFLDRYLDSGVLHQALVGTEIMKSGLTKNEDSIWPYETDHQRLLFEMLCDEEEQS